MGITMMAVGFVIAMFSYFSGYNHGYDAGLKRGKWLSRGSG